jgi:hypothetical protein
VVNHLGASGKSQDRLDLAALPSGNPYGILGVVGNQPAADFLAGLRQDAHRVTALEGAVDPPDAGGQPRENSESAPPAIASIAGVMRSTISISVASGLCAGGAV